MHLQGRSNRPDSGSSEIYVTVGEGWRIPGILSGGGFSVGWTVSKQIRHVLGGHDFAGSGAALEAVRGAGLGADVSLDVEPPIPV